MGFTTPAKAELCELIAKRIVAAASRGELAPFACGRPG